MTFDEIPKKGKIDPPYCAMPHFLLVVKTRFSYAYPYRLCFKNPQWKLPINAKFRDLGDQHHPNILVTQQQGYRTEPPVPIFCVGSGNRTWVSSLWSCNANTQIQICQIGPFFNTTVIVCKGFFSHSFRILGKGFQSETPFLLTAEDQIRDKLFSTVCGNVTLTFAIPSG